MKTQILARVPNVFVCMIKYVYIIILSDTYYHSEIVFQRRTMGTDVVEKYRKLCQVKSVRNSCAHHETFPGEQRRNES